MFGAAGTSDLKISAVMLNLIITTAQRLGVNIRDILQRHGIAFELEHIVQSTIERKQVLAVVRAVEHAAGNPAVSLLCGEDFDFEYHPHLKTFLMSASTFREAFDAVMVVQRLISPALLLEVEEAGDSAIIRLYMDRVLSEDDERRHAELVFSCLKNLGNRLMRKIIIPRAVHFRHGRSEFSPLYEDFFGCPIVLNAPANVMIYDRTLADLSLPGRFPELHRQAGDVLNQLLADSPLSSDFIQDLKRVLAVRGDLLNAPVERVARALNMSVRTLQRRLLKSNINWMRLRDQIRFQVADQDLKSRHLSIDEICIKLGFSDRRSFARAFKRWSGFSPSAYRKQRSI
jgi:AraC-like DNA-binding protein